MNAIARAAEITICCAIYAFIGLLIGIASGYIFTRLMELVVGASLVFSTLGQILVALWALFLAGLAVLAYLRSSQR